MPTSQRLPWPVSVQLKSLQLDSSPQCCDSLYPTSKFTKVGIPTFVNLGELKKLERVPCQCNGFFRRSSLENPTRHTLHVRAPRTSRQRLPLPLPVQLKSNAQLPTADPKFPKVGVSTLGNLDLRPHPWSRSDKQLPPKKRFLFRQVRIVKRKVRILAVQESIQSADESCKSQDIDFCNRIRGRSASIEVPKSRYTTFWKLRMDLPDLPRVPELTFRQAGQLGELNRTGRRAKGVNLRNAKTLDAQPAASPLLIRFPPPPLPAFVVLALFGRCAAVLLGLALFDQSFEFFGDLQSLGHGACLLKLSLRWATARR